MMMKKILELALKRGNYRTAFFVVLVIATVLCTGCGSDDPDSTSEAATDIAVLPWEQIVEQSRGQTVTLAMWIGDPYINKYMNEYVVPNVKEQYGITLNVVGAQGNEIVSNLMTELEAGKAESEYDMMWINGETFYQLRQIKGLYGPFADKLPNAQYINFNNRFINTDFQQPVDGYESPWGNVQLAIIYDTVRVPNPPRTMAALEAYVKANPGKFTFDNSFTGMTFLKSLMIALASGDAELAGKFDEAKYKKYSGMLWEYINRIKPYLWKEGKTYPNAVAPLHQMFASGEVNFTMSNNDGDVDNKVLQGLFPNTARAYVLESGTIQNSHYMGIAGSSTKKAAAMVVANFLISPEAQLKKLEPAVWGDGTVLDVTKLPMEWQEKFHSVPGRVYAPPRETIEDKALMELAPEYMIRLYDDFRTHVIEG